MARQSIPVLAVDCQPLTPDRWDDFETLFGPRGACGGCWCMTWRCSRKEFVANKGDGNRAAFKTIVDAGKEPGILAYSKGEPVGWCAVAPREDYPALERSRVLKPLDDTPVWSVSCLFVRKDSRNRGVSVSLLKGVQKFVKHRGGKMLEGYPQIPRKGEVPGPFVWTGLLSAFTAAGFTVAGQHSPARPIVRCPVSRDRPATKASRS